MKFRMAIVALAIVTLFSTACRSKVKPVAAPEPPPAAPVEQAPAPVEDFTPVKETDDGIDMSDIDALNRQAQQQGWIQDAFFDYDQSSLTAAGRDALAASARWLKQQPALGLTIEGHCDERGTSQYNLALGERRAWAARQYLESLGIEGSRLRTMSFGEERPFAEGPGESAWSQNRRAHLVLFKVE